MFLENLLGCVLVVMTTVVHYSCGQCTGQYCEDGHATVLYQKLMEQNNHLMQEVKKIRDEVRKNQEQVKKVEDKIDNITTSTNSANRDCTIDNSRIQSNSSWKHCGDVYLAGNRQSGVYRIKPTESPKPVYVYCDHSDGGGWTVFQRRIDGSVIFNRTWNGYKDGFGNLNTELWMGNDLLSLMTYETENTVRVDLQAFNGETAWAQYTNFKVQPENQNYTLQIGIYSAGTLGSSTFDLTFNNNMQFSTIDQENDPWSYAHCAIAEGDGGWWSNGCTPINLNGYYLHHPGSSDHLYIFWKNFKCCENLRSTSMRFRPSNF